MSTMRVPSGVVIAAALAITAFGIGSGESPDPRSTSPTSVSETAAPDARAIVRSLYARRYGISQDLAAIVVRQAARSGVSPEIVFRLIAVESGFDPHAVGRSGERGLMQIKPSTARVYQRGIAPEALFEPDVNLRIGLAHLKREAEHFGDWSLALAAYNMGRTRLTAVLRSGRRPPMGYAARVLADCDGDCT